MAFSFFSLSSTTFSTSRGVLSSQRAIVCIHVYSIRKSILIIFQKRKNSTPHSFTFTIWQLPATWINYGAHVWLHFSLVTCIFHFWTKFLLVDCHFFSFLVEEKEEIRFLKMQMFFICLFHFPQWLKIKPNKCRGFSNLILFFRLSLLSIYCNWFNMLS